MNFGPARATATRIFRWRRGSSSRATARRSSPSTNSCACADDIADHAKLSAQREGRACSTAWSRICSAPATAIAQAADAAPRACRAQPVAATCAGPAQGLPARRHQAALPRLGRPHRLLRLLRDAGRPLRARRAWREPQRRGRRPTRSARRCRSSITSRTAATTTAISTASMSRSTRSPLCGIERRGARRRQGIAGAAALPCRAGGAHRAPAAARATRCRCMVEDWRLALEISVIQTLAQHLTAHAHRGAIR